MYQHAFTHPLLALSSSSTSSCPTVSSFPSAPYCKKEQQRERGQEQPREMVNATLVYNFGENFLGKKTKLHTPPNYLQ